MDDFTREYSYGSKGIHVKDDLAASPGLNPTTLVGKEAIDALD